MIKAVLFDATGTLIFLPKGVGHHYQLIARRHEVELDEESTAAAFFQAWRSMPARPNVPGPRADDDKGWWRELVSQVLKNQTVGRFDDFFEELYAHFAAPGVWALYPEVTEVLEHLAERGERLAIVSNFDRRLYKILEQLQITHFFSVIVLSSEAGADKPHSAIFRAALERLGVKPAEALHVGDDPQHDWQGAGDAGLHVWKLMRPQNSLRDLLRHLESRFALAQRT